MKAFIVGMILCLVMIITVACIFSLDMVSIKQAEIRQVVSGEMMSVANEFFAGTLSDFDAAQELEERAINVLGKSVHIITNINYMNYEMKVISMSVSLTYNQVNGTTRTISASRTFILERPSYGHEYQFTRSINSNYYLLDEEEGGPKYDSIWRTPEYRTVLGTIFS